MSDWAEFAAGLAEELAGLADGAVVKIIQSASISQVRPYAQFRQLDDILWAEIVGDKWLDPAAQAGADGNQLLADAGWQRPDFDHGDNWWLESPWPMSSATYRRLAASVVTGLRDALRVADPAELVYQAWDENADNRGIELPLLGLTRAS
ncbi:hypothetical protein OG203_20495 [Nocardia sp. NBC_01499]|uniref:TY-Chap domain-containing protein n=1 Tax=Nocardia sp. NBC_01499 TaxID=2903597 RepID=UPI003868ED70